MIGKDNKYCTKIETIKKMNAYKNQKRIEKKAKKNQPITGGKDGS